MKSRSSLKIEHTVDLNSSRCMHDPSFMALALIVSEKNDLLETQKLDISQPFQVTPVYMLNKVL